MDKRKKYPHSMYGWFLIFIGAWFYGYEFILRLLPRVFHEEILQAYALSSIEFGFLASLYYYSYTLMQLPVGIIFDRYGTKKIFSLAIFTCLLGTMLINLNQSFTTLALSRIVIGFGSAFAFVGVLKIAALNLPARYFSLISGLTTTIGMLFASIGSIVMSRLMDNFDWLDLNFHLFISGIPILLSVIIFFPSSQVSKTTNTSFYGLFLDSLNLLKRPQIIAAGLVGGLLWTPTLVFLEAFGQQYLMKQTYGLSRVDVSEILSFVYGGWILGGPIIGGFAHEARYRIKALKLSLTLTTLVLLIILTYPLHLLSNSALRALFFGLGLVSSAQVLTFGIAKDAADLRYSATAIALANCLISFFGAIFPHLIGIIEFSIHSLGIKESLKYALYALPLSTFLGHALIKILERRPKKALGKEPIPGKKLPVALKTVLRRKKQHNNQDGKLTLGKSKGT